MASVVVPWAVIAMQAVPGAGTFDPGTFDPGTFDLAASSARPGRILPPPCGDAGETDTVVCGRRDDRHRLPLRDAREPAPGSRAGDAATPLAAMTPASRCGLFAGERRCNKREAADYGYGNGRDPITVLTRLAGKLVDPDAD